MHHEPQTDPAGPFDVVALVASAGGYGAITAILQALPVDFAVPIIALQHLGPDSTGTVAMYSRQTPFAVASAYTGATLVPGLVLVGPPRSFVELLPDGTCVVSPAQHGARDKPFDRLLESVARSFGRRAIAVVLTGMGADGALGARRLHLAGGTVLVQSEASAEYPQMPQAAIAAGAANLVVPLADLAQVIADLTAGIPRLQPRSELDAIRAAFGEAGEIAALARTIDWSQTAMGPVRDWPPELCTVLRLAMDYPTPYAVLWGPHFVHFYNDAALLTHGDNHPRIFGQPYFAGYAENRAAIGPLFQQVIAGSTVQQPALLAPTLHAGRRIDTWFELVYSPIRTQDGAVGGIAAVWNDRTVAVLASRRLQTLNTLIAQASAANPRKALEQALAVLNAAPDIAFAVAYQVTASQQQVNLIGAVGVKAGDALAPWMPLLADSAWPLAEVIRERRPLVVDNLGNRFSQPRPEPGGPELGEPGPEPVEQAVLHPMIDPVNKLVAAVLILGINPRLPLNDLYQAFLQLVGETVAARVAEAEARERERERMDRLYELDLNKTEFLASVSQELRAPLTLLTETLEELLRRRAELPEAAGAAVEAAAANARRLDQLVDSLLDFSKIDARNQQVNFEPVDLGALTADIADAFRSTIEAAGLRFRVEVSTDLPPIWIDRDLWEKVVSNLLVNAFKFTFTGEIAVELRALSLHAELTVRDTGIGIPEHELPNLFKRFYRVRGARARTPEGVGIGLALVQDLVGRLGGQLTVRSTEGLGSAFIIWIPYKSARIRTDAETPTVMPTPAFTPPTGPTGVATALANDAARWLLDAEPPDTELPLPA